MERPQRLLAILVALQANRQMTAAELAEQFAVSKRTVLRDIDALAAADVPVIAERGRYGGISLLPGAEIDVSRFTTTESEVLELIGLDLVKAPATRPRSSLSERCPETRSKEVLATTQTGSCKTPTE